jgi:cytochrome P450
MAGGRVPFRFMEIANDLGSYVFELSLPIPGSSKTFVVGDPVDALAILRDARTDKSRALYCCLREMTPSGEPSLFTLQSSGLEGDEWHRRRKGTLPAFSPKHVRMMNDVAYKHASEWCDTALASYALEDKGFDVVHEMLKVVLRAFCETA